MLHILGLLKQGILHDLIKDERDIVNYTLFDALSNSVIKLLPDELKHLISNSNIQIANARLHDEEIVLSNWVYSMTDPEQNTTSTNEYYTKSTMSYRNEKGHPYALISKTDSIYKIANYQGLISNIALDILKELTRRGEIANCTLNSDKIILRDYYIIETNKEYSNRIAKKYAEFIAKTQLLGYGDISFDYEIDNHHVKIKHYKGSSKDVIIPSFITVITQGAFCDADIRTITLNEGLEIIGEEAFLANWTHEGLQRIEIPSTVKLIEPRAFAGNDNLFKDSSKLDPRKFILRNKNTLVLHQY